MTSIVVTQVVKHPELLPLNLPEQVLPFVSALDSSIRHGVPGKQLLQFTEAIPEDELQLMSQLIRDGCEQVDINE